MVLVTNATVLKVQQTQTNLMLLFSGIKLSMSLPVLLTTQLVATKKIFPLAALIMVLNQLIQCLTTFQTTTMTRVLEQEQATFKFLEPEQLIHTPCNSRITLVQSFHC